MVRTFGAKVTTGAELGRIIAAKEYPVDNKKAGAVGNRMVFKVDAKADIARINKSMPTTDADKAVVFVSVKAKNPCGSWSKWSEPLVLYQCKSTKAGGNRWVDLLMGDNGSTILLAGGTSGNNYLTNLSKNKVALYTDVK